MAKIRTRYLLNCIYCIGRVMFLLTMSTVRSIYNEITFDFVDRDLESLLDVRVPSFPGQRDPFLNFAATLEPPGEDAIRRAQISCWPEATTDDSVDEMMRVFEVSALAVRNLLRDVG